MKTSTGFGKGGATVEDVQLMRSIVGRELGVKASGGVRNAEDAIKMAQAGANAARHVGVDRDRDEQERRQVEGLLSASIVGDGDLSCLTLAASRAWSDRDGPQATAESAARSSSWAARADRARRRDVRVIARNHRAVLMLPVQLIRKKRDGGVLDDDEIRFFIAGITDGSIPDYQVSAMTMAIFFNGLGDRELAIWADAMTRSGDVIDLSAITRAKVDKHSTGGVGDKISIPLAPAVAACGVAVPMVSGRGLGHTGGTLDKLESIPGFRVDLPVERFIELVDKLGVCLIGQTARIAPADKRLYALRDVTATVESLPLIASSIMSKKLAEGIDGLVIDCKVGAARS